jgi:hypothetical protein
MNKKEAKRLQEILDTCREAFYRTIDNEEDYSFVFGTPAKCKFMEEGHIHKDMAIYDIKFVKEGIEIHTDHWVNKNGMEIYVTIPYFVRKLRGTQIEKVSPISKGRNRLHSGRQYVVSICWNNSEFADVLPYPLETIEFVLHYLIDNFRLKEVKYNIELLRRFKARKEFGLTMPPDKSYYETKKDEVICKIVDYHSVEDVNEKEKSEKAR